MIKKLLSFLNSFLPNTTIAYYPPLDWGVKKYTFECPLCKELTTNCYELADDEDEAFKSVCFKCNGIINVREPQEFR